MYVFEAEPPTIAEQVQEGHLRLAVLLDLIEDERTAGHLVSPRLEELRREYDRHARHQEQVMAAFLPELLEHHRRSHDRMRLLLDSLGGVHDGGHDIGPVLNQIVQMFTGKLMPEDMVFRRLDTPSSR